MKLTREQAIELLMASELDEDGHLIISGIDVDPPYLRHHTLEYQDVDGKVITAEEHFEPLDGRIVIRVPFVTPPLNLEAS